MTATKSAGCGAAPPVTGPGVRFAPAAREWAAGGEPRATGWVARSTPAATQTPAPHQRPAVCAAPARQKPIIPRRAAV
jgi:hypothetical protein